ncbi:MAG: hypothetical protein AAF724_17500 [Pseudomonadota bacterium]
MHSKQAYGVAGRPNRRDRFEYRIVWALCFVLYLAAALVRRAAGWTSGTNKFRNQRQPILSEAKSAACAAAGYAFMG